MLNLYIEDEVSRLAEVIVGVADSLGGIPKLESLYDPKSRLHLLEGTYPEESDMVEEIKQFVDVLLKHKVKVHRPSIITNCNQIFTRDLAFVIEDKFICSNILPHREKELQALMSIKKQIHPSKIIIPPNDVHIEGGDVILWGNYIFIGTYFGEDYPDYITARTNSEGVEFIKKCFPNREIKSFDLVKSNTDPYKNALHLDCCFQIIGNGKVIIHKEGFVHPEDVLFIEHLFGAENLFTVDSMEMCQMFCNVFSISADVVVSERGFHRLNKWIRSLGISVEEIKYSEVSKQEGLLRCSTLPLSRLS